MALADPMVGSSADRASRICAEIRSPPRLPTRVGAAGGLCAEAVVISRIPGASHCALEGQVIGEIVQAELDVPVLEIEVPSLTDSIAQALRTRLEALVEAVRERRKK